MNTSTPCSISSSFALRHERGLSLVEILVGVAIGLIGIVMMFQLLENWEVRKRTTSAGSDAQTAGSIASFRLIQDIRQAGYGFGTAGTKIGCPVSTYDSDRVIAYFPSPVRMVPVQINDGAAGAPDIVTVLYGNSPIMSASYRYTTSTAFSKKTATEGPRNGIRRGDLMIVAPDAVACGLVRITDNTDPDGLTVSHTNGTFVDQDGGAPQPTRFNDPVGFLGTPPAGTWGTLYNMGTSPNRNVWQINGRMLTVRNDLLNGTAEDVAEGVINLQAEYGLDTTVPPDNVIDVWQSANPASWSTVRAIRVAILARSQQFEKTAVTNAAPLTGWNDAANNPVAFVMKDLDGNAPALDNTPNDWRHYRYRVYTTTVPLRNMVWGSTPGAPL